MVRVVAAATVVAVAGVATVAFVAVVDRGASDPALFAALAGFLAFLGTLVNALMTALNREKIEQVKQKTEEVKQQAEKTHYDMLNGGLRRNVKQAISEDRHEKAQQETTQRGWEQLGERRERKAQAVRRKDHPGGAHQHDDS